MPTFFDALNELMAAEAPLVAVTVVDTIGSVPQDRGAKMIVTAEGLRFGTVGGGKVETKAIAEAQAMLRGEAAETTKFAQWNLNKDVGMTCGGIVKLYFESHNVGRWRIVVFGAGHVANAVVNAARPPRLPRHLHRSARGVAGEAARVAEADEGADADMPSLVKTIPDDAFVVLMTMGHTTDKPILLEILRTRTFPYLGVIGSDAKAKILRRDIAEAGLPEEAKRAFYCPIGLRSGRTIRTRSR